MREKNYDEFYDGLDEQELEDALLNYGIEKKKRFPLAMVVVGSLVIGGCIGILVSSKSDARGAAEASVAEAQRVAAQTGTGVNSQSAIRTSEENINTPGQATITHLYIEGYNEDLTEEANQVLAEIYPDISTVSYGKLLTEACKNGTIESDVQTIVKEHSTSNSYIFASCELDINYNDEMLEYGLTNDYMHQDHVCAYWVGAVAENDKYVIYILFEKN